MFWFEKAIRFWPKSWKIKGEREWTECILWPYIYIYCNDGENGIFCQSGLRRSSWLSDCVSEWVIKSVCFGVHLNHRDYCSKNRQPKSSNSTSNRQNPQNFTYKIIRSIYLSVLWLFDVSDFYPIIDSKKKMEFKPVISIEIHRMLLVFFIFSKTEKNAHTHNDISENYIEF